MTSDNKCPDCDGPMVLRTNRETKEQFYGCKAYPECTGTREAVDEYDQPIRADRDEMPSDRYRRADRGRWRDE